MSRYSARLFLLIFILIGLHESGASHLIIEFSLSTRLIMTSYFYVLYRYYTQLTCIFLSEISLKGNVIKNDGWSADSLMMEHSGQRLYLL